MATQFESEFESGYTQYQGQITSCVVSEQPGQVTPFDKVLNAQSTWYINLTWNVQGLSVPVQTGHWHVQAFFESIGTGPDVDLPNPSIQIPCNPGTFQYNAALPIAAGAIPIPAGQTRPYKAVVTVTFHTPAGAPGPMAGFVELPVLQFYA